MQDWTPKDLEHNLDIGGTVFLKLWKKGCGPCKLSIAAVERIEAQYSSSMVFGQICIDDHPEMVGLAGADVLPAFFVFSDRKKKGSFLGFKGLEKLKEFVAAALA